MNSTKNHEKGLALECAGVTKRFLGLQAVDRVDLQVEHGERLAIIGPNGAGKTTLFSLISGLYPVTSGSIYLAGKDITRMPPHRRTYLGLSRTFQITTLFPRLTVWENLVIAAMGLEKTKFSMIKPISRYHHLKERVLGLLDSVGMQGKGEVAVKNLSHGEQRQIEICLALISNPSLLLLDEPTAGLSPA